MEGTPETDSLRVGLELIASADPVEREAGCELLGRVSDHHEGVRAESAAALVALAGRETTSGVLQALVRAIEKTGDQGGVSVLAGLAVHRDAGIRRQVAESFAYVLTGLPDGRDIGALIALTRDEDPEVRDWATFTLGSQAAVDSPAIRSTLWKRTADDHAETREEAIRGLARRHDPRAVQLLIELLEDPEGADILTFGAAQTMGAAELLPALLGYDPDGIGVSDAVEACDPARRARLDTWAWDLVRELHRLRPELDAAASMERFAPGLSIEVTTASGRLDYSVSALRDRAGGDVERAAELVAGDLSAFG